MADDENVVEIAPEDVEFIDDNEVYSGNVEKIIISIFVGVSAAAAIFIYRKFFKKCKTDNEDEEGAVAYSYEDAVAKAKAKLANGGSDDGVKLSKDIDKPKIDIDTLTTPSEVLENNFRKEKVAYNNLSRIYSDGSPVHEENEEEKPTILTEKPPEVYKYAVLSKFVLITEDDYSYENQYNEKIKCMYDPNEHAILSVDGSVIDEPELTDYMKAIYEDPAMTEDIYYFNLKDEMIDYMVEIVD